MRAVYPLCVCSVLAAAVSVAMADVPRLVSYSGKIAGAAGGTADMRVALWDSAVGGALLFSENHLGVPLNNGVFSIMLGSETAGGVDDAALDATEVWLGINLGAGELAPRTRIGMVPYAAKARSAEQLVRPGTFDAVMRTDSLGNVDVDNHLDFALQNAPLITAGHDNTIDKRMWIAHSEAFPTWGIQYRDFSSDGFASDSIEFTSGDQTSPRMSFELFNGRMHMMNSGGTENIRLDSAAGGQVQAMNRLALVQAIGGNEFASLGTNGTGGGVLRTRDEANNQTVILGSVNTGGGGFMNMHLDASIWPGVALRASTFGSMTLNQDNGAGGFNTRVTIDANGSGSASFLQADGDPGVDILGASGQMKGYGSDGLENWRLWDGSWGELFLYDSSATNDQTVVLSATSNSGGQLSLRNADASLTTVIADGHNADGAGEITLRHSDGTQTVAISGEDPDFNTGSCIRVFNDVGARTLDVDSDQGDGGSVLTMYNSAGTAVITMDSEFAGDGRIITQELQITGGSDLSEQFDVNAGVGEVKPGMVVCIDPAHVGKLIVSSKPHDRAVAGIISGAGGVNPGMLMGQNNTVADGAHPIALTGRVWVCCDASSGAIQAGDMLTTSSTPGHAMKVSDFSKAYGTTIGKAMSPLESGRGLVLVLVNLQ